MNPDEIQDAGGQTAGKIMVKHHPGLLVPPVSSHKQNREPALFNQGARTRRGLLASWFSQQQTVNRYPHLSGRYHPKRRRKEGERMFFIERINKENFLKNAPLFVKRPIPVRATQMNTVFQVKTEEGVMDGSVGDYLVEGIEGEIYSVKRHIFEKTYKIYTGGKESPDA